MKTQLEYNDGGRKAAGRKGDAGDCVVRAIAIACELPYGRVYDDLNDLIASVRQTKYARGSSARTGIYRPIYDKYLAALGWVWTPTMQIGSGCRVHLRPYELPPGRLIVKVSRHLAAVIDGVLHDTFDCSRNGTRCVYGYWRQSMNSLRKED